MAVAEPAVVLRTVDLDDPLARDLELRLIAETKARYGERGQRPLVGADFDAPTGRFVLAEIDGRPIGCGGFRPLREGIAEVKRMFVDPEFRNRGVARRVLFCLEELAVAAGYAEFWLETGARQPEAIALYEGCGYRPITPYGEFKGDPRSRCFARSLTTRHESFENQPSGSDPEMS